MNRRRFLQALGLAPIAAKTYVFFGGVYRPSPLSLMDNEAVAQWFREYAKLLQLEMTRLYGYPSRKWFTLRLKE